MNVTTKALREYELVKKTDRDGETRGASKPGDSSVKVLEDGKKSRKIDENRSKTPITSHGSSNRRSILQHWKKGSQGSCSGG